MSRFFIVLMIGFLALQLSETKGSNGLDSLSSLSQNKITDIEALMDTSKTDSLSKIIVETEIDSLKMIFEALVNAAKEIEYQASLRKTAEEKKINSIMDLVVQDKIHYAAYGVILLLLFFVVIFLLMMISARKKYKTLNIEVYDIEELLNKYDKKNIDNFEKLSKLYTEFRELHNKFEDLETDKINCEENLSYLKVENNKYLEKIDEMDKQLNDKEKNITESINTILELEKQLEKEKDTIEQISSGKIPTGFSEKSKKELEELDLNIAKLEKLSKLKESRTISDQEFNELKKQIIDRLK